MLAASSRLISTLLAHRDGSIPLHQWLLVIRKNVLDEMFGEETGLSDETENFEDLLRVSDKARVEAYTVEIFGNQG